MSTLHPHVAPCRPGPGRYAVVLGVAAALFVATTAATAQLPSVDGFLAEPLHTVRGRVSLESYGAAGSRLGVELTMPTSVDVGDFAVDREHFERHSIMLPSIQIAWARGHDLDDLLGPTVASVTRGEGFVLTETAGAVTRGDGWVARVWTSELRADSDGSVCRRPRVEVLMRVASPRDMVCLGHGGTETMEADADRVRDWLLERCRSVRVVELP